MQHNFSLLLLFFALCLLSQRALSQAYYYETSVPVEVGQQPLKMPWAGGLNVVQAGMADTNGDKQPELVLFDRSSTQVQVFAQTSEGWIWLPEERFRFPADVSNWLLLVDYNGDGRKDLFTYTNAGVRVFKNMAAEGKAAIWELEHSLLMYPGSRGAVNLLVNSGDIPLIADTDGDGDIDIAAFDPAGSSTIRWYQNVAVEEFGRTDTLVYKLTDRHWGGISECHCKEVALNYTPCPDEGGRSGQRPLHAGGKSMLWQDINGDGLSDLLLGEEECSLLYYLPNTGTQDSPKFETVEIGLPGAATTPDFPYQAAYSFGDDILISTNLKNSSQLINLQQSLWLYEQQAGGAYALTQKDFLQAQMLDAGEEARPAFFDFDHDGDQDLLLGSKGSLQADGYYASLQLYENTGTAAAPAFRLKDKDFLGLSAAKYQYMQPQIVDFNKDGAQDLLLNLLDRTQNKVRTLVFFNKASKEIPARYEMPHSLELPLSLTTLDYPHFYDVSGDGLPDALLGRFDGSLQLFTNTGTVAAPVFSLSTPAYKDFQLDNVHRHLIPSVGDADADGKPDLIVTDASGTLRILYNFLAESASASNITSPQINVGDEQVISPRLGDKSWSALVSLWSADKPALVLGQIGGGLVLLRHEPNTEPPTADEFSLMVSPNPSGNRPVTIKTNAPAELRVVNMLGQIIVRWYTLGEHPIMWEPRQPPGMYVVEAHFGKERRIFKLLLTP